LIRKIQLDRLCKMCFLSCLHNIHEDKDLVVNRYFCMNIQVDIEYMLLTFHKNNNQNCMLQGLNLHCCIGIQLGISCIEPILLNYYKFHLDR